jgi:hypothetical protein
VVVLGLAAVVVATVLVPFLRERHRAVDRSPVVAEGATVLYRTVHLVCGCREEREVPVWPELVGCTQEEVMKHLAGWTLVSFSPTRIEVERQVEDMCPDMVRYRFLTIADGRVAVYYGRSREHLLLKEVTAVDARQLLPEDRERLEQGLVLEGDSEVQRFLEGLGD